MEVAIKILEDMLGWSDRLGSDEIYTIQEAVARMKKELK